MAFVESEFDELIAGGLDPVVIALQETFNGEAFAPTYSFRRFLGKQYSIDGTWKSLGIDNGLIAADIVALDSPLPVKERPALRQAGGLVPKIGTELPMNETDIKQLRLLMRAGGDMNLVRSLLFSDVRRVYGGVLEQIEYRFLQGLSQGFFIAQANGGPGADQDNVGLGVRANFGYATDHQFDASVVWGNTGYTAVGDLVNMVNSASDNGQQIVVVMMDNATKNLLLNSDDAKDFVANFSGGLNNGTVPTLTRFNDAIETEYGFRIETVNRSITTQINGVKTNQKAWADGQVIGLTQQQVGTLVWSDVEEMNAPVGGVNYSTAEDFILISQYRAARPSLKQWTSSQAVAIPVVNSEVVYKLDSTTAQTT